MYYTIVPTYLLLYCEDSLRYFQSDSKCHLNINSNLRNDAKKTEQEEEMLPQSRKVPKKKEEAELGTAVVVVVVLW